MNKQELLNTQMNQLGLGRNFNRWFFSNSFGNSIGQEEVITLSKFIEENNELMTNKDVCLCMLREDGSWYRGFIKDSVSFRKLKKLLLDNGFTHQDWILLLSDVETPKGKRPNYSLLEKEVLLDLPYFKVCGVKQTSSPAEQIEYYFVHEESHSRVEYILVRDILILNMEKIESNMPMRLVEKTFKAVQKKLKEYGFTSEDGSFMSIKFSEAKSKNNFVEDLIKYKGFTRRDAKIAVEFGVRAGWIQV